MKRTLCLSFVPLVLLAVAANAQPAGPPETLQVEVLAVDPDAGTLTYRSNDVDTTLMVAGQALDPLRAARPGDRITVTVRDDAGRRRVVSAVVDATATGPRASERVSVRRVAGTTVEVVSHDAGAATITLREAGGDRVYVVGPGAADTLGTLAPGEKALLSWRFNRQGRPEAVIRPFPAGYDLTTPITSVSSPAVTVHRSAGEGTVVMNPRALPPDAVAQTLTEPVEVLAVDVDGRTMTVRDGHGEEHSVPFDRKAQYGLLAIRPGDRVELSWGPNGQVVYINVR